MPSHSVPRDLGGMSAATYRPLVRLNCPRCASVARPDDSHCRQCGIWLAGPPPAELRWIDPDPAQAEEHRTALICRRMELVAELARQSPAETAAEPVLPGVSAAELVPVARTARPGESRPAGFVPRGLRSAESRPAEFVRSGRLRSGESRPAEFLRSGGLRSGELRRAEPNPAGLNPAELNAAQGRGEFSRRAVARLLLSAGATLVVIAAAVFTVANWSSIGPLGRSLILLGVTALVVAAPAALTKRGLAATA